jgi:hypothetical protein
MRMASVIGCWKSFRGWENPTVLVWNSVLDRFIPKVDAAQKEKKQSDVLTLVSGPELYVPHLDCDRLQTSVRLIIPSQTFVYRSRVYILLVTLRYADTYTQTPLCLSSPSFPSPPKMRSLALASCDVAAFSDLCLIGSPYNAATPGIHSLLRSALVGEVHRDIGGV